MWMLNNTATFRATVGPGEANNTAGLHQNNPIDMMWYRYQRHQSKTNNDTLSKQISEDCREDYLLSHLSITIEWFGNNSYPIVSSIQNRMFEFSKIGIFTKFLTHKIWVIVQPNLNIQTKNVETCALILLSSDNLYSVSSSSYKHNFNSSLQFHFYTHKRHKSSIIFMNLPN